MRGRVAAVPRDPMLIPSFLYRKYCVILLLATELPLSPCRKGYIRVIYLAPRLRILRLGGILCHGC
jgi:hypothetical protein